MAALHIKIGIQRQPEKIKNTLLERKTLQLETSRGKSVRKRRGCTSYIITQWPFFKQNLKLVNKINTQRKKTQSVGNERLKVHNPS